MGPLSSEGVDGAMTLLFLIAAAMWCALICYAATKSWWD